jgi:hypothetical protein
MPKRRKPTNNRPPAVRKGGAHDAQAQADTPGKVRTCAERARVLMGFAGQLRAIPGMNLSPVTEAEDMAGRYLAEVLRHGAFARIKHLPLRCRVDQRIEKGLYGSAFGEAVYWLRVNEPHWPAVSACPDIGSPIDVKNGCPLLADAIEGEIDVPESERTLTPPVPGRLEADELRRRNEEKIQTRKERHDQREATRAAVAGGKCGYADKPGMVVITRGGSFPAPLPASDQDPKGPDQAPKGEWSKPMRKGKMMDALRIPSLRTFNAWAKGHGIRFAGNRLTLQLKLEGLTKEQQDRLAKA